MKPPQKKWLLFFSIILISFIFLLPLFKNFNNWGIQDWDWDIFTHGVPRLTMVKYHQFPLWNPYYCGGVPLLANPQSKFLSPFFLFILAFGEVKGLKINIFLHLIIGLIGAYHLIRNYKLNSMASIFGSFIYMLSSLYSLPITTGMSTFMFMAYIPWIFLCYKKTFSQPKFLFPTIFTLLFMFFGGGIQLFTITLIFLTAYSILQITLRKQPLIKTIKILLTTILLVLLLGAIKLLPAIEFLSQYPRKINSYSGYSLNSLQYSLFNRNQSLAAEDLFPIRAFGFLDGISSAMDENGMYIGLIPFILFLIGIILYFRRQLVLSLLFIIFLWLSFGNRIPIRYLRLWGFLRKLPLFDSMREAQRFRFIFMLCLAIFAAFGFQALINFLKKKVKHPILTQLFLISFITYILFDLMAVNSLVLNEACPITPFPLESQNIFSQIWKNPNYNRFGFSSFEINRFGSRSSLYPTFLANMGTISCYEPIPIPRNANPKNSPAYKGEIYLQNANGRVTINQWSPNKIRISLNVLGNDYLILNQNYFSGWKIKSTTNKNHPEAIKQLLGIKVTPEDKEIELYYLPTSFIIGSAISLLTFFSIILFINNNKYFTLKTRKEENWHQ